jgi:uncharacterized protein
MRKKFPLVILLLINYLLVFSQPNDVNLNGYNKFYYPNGQLSSEGLMRDGKPDGYWITYYVNGKKKSEGVRKNTLLDSIWSFYNEKGDTTEKITYLYGMKSGFYYTFKQNAEEGKPNVLSSKELFLNNKRQGRSYYYYPNGAVYQIINYKDGRKEGQGREFSKEGIPISILQFRNDLLVDKEMINRRDMNGLKQGVWREYFANETVKFESSYKNDKLDGYVKEYDIKGKLLKSDRYINGKLIVVTADTETRMEVKVKYYESGKIKESGGFIEGKPVGIHRAYTEEGKITTSTVYSSVGTLEGEGLYDDDGNRQGEWKEYFENGKVKASGKYKDNRREGAWKYFFENGTVEQKGQYKNGKEDGIWTWYYPNGTLLREDEYVNGKEDGILTEYKTDGTIIAKGQYIEGEKNGKWYYSVGDETEEGSYKNDLYDGEWKHYFINKNLSFEGSFVQGDPNGCHRYYHENGKLKLESFYKMGKKDDTWRYFDELGNLVMTITYKNDKEERVDGNKIND